ncbi:hypothetical protein KPH14_012713 [Odynerus spinipes]|uniref:Retrotransposon gag domain-containing protein n=1 Tax=Odynerus spinipes TaxID=1348599 RepID=A0AAD9REC7_9HYME|nr:hypothetical protein KPH14_012713 [Odynerus spinipes]
MAVARSPQRTMTSTEPCEEIDEDRNIEEVWAELRREREEFEKRKAEFEKKKMTSVASGTRSKTKKAIDKSGESEQVIETEGHLVSGIINHMQYLQNDFKVEKFSDENRRNPNEFLEEVEKYFRFRGVRDEHKVLVIESFLEGRARLWADTMGNGVRSYAVFRQRFLDEFYSIPIQVKLRNQWLSRRYRPSEGTLQHYFYDQLRAARYFEPVMSAYETNYSIAQQFPLRVREALSTVDYSMTTSMAQALAQLEAIQKERDNERRRNQWDERGMGGRRNDIANVRAMQGNRWSTSQANAYRDRQNFRQFVPYNRNY